jgi:hypothetical protein
MPKIAYVALVCVVSMVCAATLKDPDLFLYCAVGSFILLAASYFIDAVLRRE